MDEPRRVHAREAARPRKRRRVVPETVTVTDIDASPSSYVRIDTRALSEAERLIAVLSRVAANEDLDDADRNALELCRLALGFRDSGLGLLRVADVLANAGERSC